MRIFRLQHADFFESFDGEYGNSIFLSSLRSFQLETRNTCLSIKVSLNAVEEYHIARRRIAVPRQHFCILNPRDKVEAFVNSKSPVNGVSVFLEHDMVRDVFWNLHRKEIDLDAEPPTNMEIPWFEESVTPCLKSRMGRELLSLGGGFPQSDTRSSQSPLDPAPNNQPPIDREFFINIAEQMILSQRTYWKRLNRIPVVKRTTKIEILRRLAIAHRHMIEMQNPTTSIRDLAMICAMSEYNFIRQFAAAYGQSPYQFLLTQKIEKAKQLLVSDPDTTIAEIASKLGFANHSAFGKRFRTATGFTPTQFRSSKHSS